MEVDYLEMSQDKKFESTEVQYKVVCDLSKNVMTFDLRCL